MQDKKQKQNIKKQTTSLITTILLVCAILIGGGIFLSYITTKHKQQSIDVHFSTNRIENMAQMTKKYKEFWVRYDIVLVQRANEDGNPAISVEEKKDFDDGFFGTLGLVVDQQTKVITTTDGSYPNETALICRINSYYPTSPWIHPICPDL